MKQTQIVTKLKLLLPFMGSLMICGLILNRIDLKLLFEHIHPENAYFLIVAGVCSSITILGTGIAKLYIMARASGLSLSLSECSVINLGGNPVRLALPFKTGEMFKALYLLNRYQFPLERGMALIVLDKVFNVTGSLCYLIFGSCLQTVKISIILFAILAIAPFFLLSWAPIRNRIPVESWLLAGAIKRSLARFIQPFTMIRGRSRLKLLLLGILIQTGYIASIWFIFYAYAVTIPLVFLCAVIPMVSIITSLPVTFAGVGAREFSIMFFFSQYASQEQLLCIGAAITLLSNVAPDIIGFPLSPLFLKRALQKQNAVRSSSINYRNGE